MTINNKYLQHSRRYKRDSKRSYCELEVQFSFKFSSILLTILFITYVYRIIFKILSIKTLFYVFLRVA